MIVTIPSLINHGGFGLVTLEISDHCPICGAYRGEIFGTHSFDGSRRLNVDGWNNSCGHIDKYSAVRKEGTIVPFKEPKEFENIQAEDRKVIITHFWGGHAADDFYCQYQLIDKEGKSSTITQEEYNKLPDCISVEHHDDESILKSQSADERFG